MKSKTSILSLIVLLFLSCTTSKQKETKNLSEYTVTKLSQSLKIDGDWNKPQWLNIKEIDIRNRMGDEPLFTPSVQAKMTYDSNNLYVIFRVNDKYVRCLVTEYNGLVYEEPAVEFFFSPDPEKPLKYFNLEINCGGTPLMQFNDFAAKAQSFLKTEDIKEIEIAHSLPRVVDPEISEPVTWTIEYRIPLAMLEKYSKVVYPKPGTEWRANFYKIAEKGSNVHFLTWSFVDNPEPDFHLPQFFGKLKFE